MNRIDRYLTRTVLLTTTIVVFALLGIITLFSFMAEIEDIKGDYQVWQVWQYTFYTTPRRFYELIPYCGLIGCLLGLGLLSNNSELIVMRAAGVSVLRISMGAMIPVLLLTMLGLAVGEFIVPGAERKAQVDRENARESRIMSALGFWYREGNTYMHFRRLEADGRLTGITHYLFDDGDKLTRTLFAERGTFHRAGSQETWWELEDVSVTRLSPLGSEAVQMAEWRWDTELNPDTLRSEILVRPDKLSIGGLLEKIDYLTRQGLDSMPHQIALWQKSLQPLATLALVFVAITFIMGPLREVSMGMRIVAGMITGILFKFIQDLLTPATIVFGMHPAVATLIPILACVAFGVYLMRREI